MAWNRPIIGMIWLAVCLAGAYAAMNYDFKPGSLAAPLASWPADLSNLDLAARLERPQKLTVVAFLHPRCACSRATVKQLVKTLQAHPVPEIIVSVYTPLDAVDKAAWEQSDSVKMVIEKLPAAQVIADRGGVLASRFGAFTSGTLLVYDSKGDEIFRGGITDRRGGEEDNPGLRQFAQAISEEVRVQTETSPVFGCLLVAGGNG